MKKLDVLEKLIDNLKIRKENVIIVGSSALRLNGFNISVDDIDIEIINVNPYNFLIEKLNLLQQANQIIYPYKSDKNRFDFIFNGVKFNIWVKVKTEHIIQTNYKGIWVAGINTVLKEKRKLGRKKDFETFEKLILQILYNDKI